MRKAVAVLRSIVLLAIIVLALMNTPFEVFGNEDSMVAVRRIRKIVQATWLAIGWISIETAVSWFRALRKSAPAAASAPVASAASPPAA